MSRWCIHSTAKSLPAKEMKKMENKDKRQRKRLRPLLERMLNEKIFDSCGLKWIDNGKLFQIPWKIHRKSNDSDDDAKVITYIAKEMWPNRKNLTVWKELLRNSMTSLDDFQRVKDETAKKNNFKVYKFVDQKPKRRGLKLRNTQLTVCSSGEPGSNQNLSAASLSDYLGMECPLSSIGGPRSSSPVRRKEHPARSQQQNIHIIGLDVDQPVLSHSTQWKEVVVENNDIQPVFTLSGEHLYTSNGQQFQISQPEADFPQLDQLQLRIQSEGISPSILQQNTQTDAHMFVATTMLHESTTCKEAALENNYTALPQVSDNHQTMSLNVPYLGGLLPTHVPIDVTNIHTTQFSCPVTSSNTLTLNSDGIPGFELNDSIDQIQTIGKSTAGLITPNPLVTNCNNCTLIVPNYNLINCTMHHSPIPTVNMPAEREQTISACIPAQVSNAIPVLAVPPTVNGPQCSTTLNFSDTNAILDYPALSVVDGSPFRLKSENISELLVLEVYYHKQLVLREFVDDGVCTIYRGKSLYNRTGAVLGKIIQLPDPEKYFKQIGSVEHLKKLNDAIKGIWKKMALGVTISMKNNSIFAVRRCQTRVIAKVINESKSKKLNREENTEIFSGAAFINSILNHTDYCDWGTTRVASLPSDKCRLTFGVDKAIDDSEYGAIDIYVQHFEAHKLLCSLQEQVLNSIIPSNSISNSFDQIVQSLERITISAQSVNGTAPSPTPLSL